MRRVELLQNVGVAFLAQGVSMVLSVIQTLLVPKVLGVEQFSYWQLYLFYVSYVGFFHFGLSSGVYLEMGGIPRDRMDKDSVKSQFLFGVAFQSVIAACIAAASVALVPDPERKFVLIQVALALVLKNAATYMMNVLQCMNETKRSSASTIVERLAFFVPLATLMLTGVRSFRPYVCAYTLAAVAQLAYCLWHLRDFARARWVGAKEATRQGLRSMSFGISLMVANVASMLILGVARFTIDARWGIETFGRLSLVMSLVNFFLAFVNQAGLVLFPALRQSGDTEVRSFYVTARDALALLFPAVYLLYYPMVWLLGTWLPGYADALSYLALLLPICVFDSKMSITGSTYFNVLRKERVMLALNAGSATLSLMLALAGAYLLGSVAAVISGMVITIVLRSLVAELYLSRELGVGVTPTTVGEVVLTSLFVLSQALLPDQVAFCSYAATYIGYLTLVRGRLHSVITSLAK